MSKLQCAAVVWALTRAIPRPICAPCNRWLTGSDFDDGSDSCSEGECRDADADPPAPGARERLTGYCHSGMGKAALFLGRKFGRVLHELCVGAGWQVTTAGHSLGAGESCVHGSGADLCRCFLSECGFAGKLGAVDDQRRCSLLPLRMS